MSVFARLTGQRLYSSMRHSSFARITFIVVAMAGAAEPGHAEATTACSAPVQMLRLDYPLARTAKKLASNEPITIVAIGSSSTAGAGASSPAASYPSRLQVELKARFPQQSIKVLNRGANGEDAREMLARFGPSVIAENPDLVLWQVGTNALLLDRPLSPAGERIREGLSRLRAAEADVVLVDPQFAPKVLAKPDIEKLMEIYSVLAKESNVGVFKRFSVMRHWRETLNIPFKAFLSEDELHMNDWSYACLAKLLASAVEDAARRSTATAQAGAVR